MNNIKVNSNETLSIIKNKFNGILIFSINKQNYLTKDEKAKGLTDTFNVMEQSEKDKIADEILNVLENHI